MPASPVDAPAGAVPMLRGAYVERRDLLALRDQIGRPRRRRARRERGERSSRVRGRGMDFAEVRAYQPGDDVRTIDWRVTARRNTVHTKVFHEERERPTLIVVEQTPSLFFGSRVRLKSVAAAEHAARLAWLSLARRERVGGLVLGAQDTARHRPLASVQAVARLLGDVACANQALARGQAPRPALGAALADITTAARGGHRIFLVSDCYGIAPEDRRALLRLARSNDVHALFVYDPLELELPPADQYQVTDGERVVAFDSANTGLRRSYRERFSARRDALLGLCRDAGVHAQLVATDQPWLP